MNLYQVAYQRHAVERMAQRGIREEDVEHVLLTGEAIESYPDDTPYPSELLLGWCERQALGGDDHEMCHVQIWRDSAGNDHHDA
jgi:hypothetical protein